VNSTIWEGWKIRPIMDWKTQKYSLWWAGVGDIY